VRIALVVAALGLVLASPAAAAGDAKRGRDLFRTGCASCHGIDARGIRGKGPSLHGAGAAAAHFYLSTGRMPLDEPKAQPDRAEPAYDPAAIDDLVAYVGSLGGPDVPSVEVSTGIVSDGQRLFTRNCAACHQIMGRGGVVTGAYVPTLLESTPTQIAEAMRIGPYVMPRFGTGRLSDQDIASTARYVEYAKHPRNEGGWGLFDIGPVPEGMVAWLIGLLALVLLIRALGKRTTP
jgi:ubiquinol-cytochrome c reductase cytochrome c subunit